MAQQDQADVEFETLQEEYSAKSFYEHFKDNLPQMAMVTQGYMGEVTFETFDRGQVFRIQTYSTQKRVVAVLISGEKGMYGLQGRQISIPADYDVKFNIIKHGKPKGGKPASLKEIIEHNKLPIEVQFAGGEDQPIKIGESERTGYNLCTLKILNTYDDFYLLGNAICYGNLYGAVTAVPAYLPDLRFSIVNAIKGYTDEQYQHFLNVADQFVKEHIRFDPTFGNTDIALYSHDKAHEDESYSYISPCEYYNISDLLRSNKLKPAVQQGKKGAGNVYEVMRISTCSLPGEFSNQTYDALNAIKTKPTDQKPASKLPEVTSQQSKDKTDLNVGSTSGNTDQTDPMMDKKQKPPPIASKPDPTMLRKTLSVDTPTTKDSDVPPVVPKRISVSALPKEKDGTGVSVTEIRRQFGGDTPNVGRAVPVQTVPASVPESTTVTSPVQSTSHAESETVIDISSLTIEEVFEWLKKLKLSKYADVFMENQVDGAILLDIDEQMLKEDFGMSRFEILKLMKFVKQGHVPKHKRT